MINRRIFLLILALIVLSISTAHAKPSWGASPVHHYYSPDTGPYTVIDNPDGSKTIYPITVYDE